MSETAGREGDCIREETPTVEFLVCLEVEDSWEEEVSCQRNIYLCNSQWIKMQCLEESIKPFEKRYSVEMKIQLGY